MQKDLNTRGHSNIKMTALGAQRASVSHVKSRIPSCIKIASHPVDANTDRLNIVKGQISLRVTEVDSSESRRTILAR